MSAPGFRNRARRAGQPAPRRKWATASSDSDGAGETEDNRQKQMSMEAFDAAVSAEPQQSLSKKEPTPSVKPLKKNKAKTNTKAKAAVLSFGGDEDGEDAGEPVVRIRKERNSAPTSLAWGAAAAFGSTEREEMDLQRERKLRPQAPSYTIDALRELQLSQAAAPQIAIEGGGEGDGHSNKAAVDQSGGDDGDMHIPDSKTIRAARRLREQRREAAKATAAAEQSTASNETPSFISLSGETAVSRRRPESRIVTEDQDAEGDEAFEDHAGETLAFGAQAIVNAKEASREAMREDVQRVMIEGDDDDEVVAWEMQQIHKGQRADAATIGASRLFSGSKLATGSTTMAIPELIPIPSVSQVASTLDKAVATLMDQKEQHASQLSTAGIEAQALNDAIVRLESDLKQATERYEYFQQLTVFVGDLDNFLDTKISLLEGLERDMLYWQTEKVNTNLNERWRMLDALFTRFTGVAFTQPPPGDKDQYAEKKAEPERTLDQVRDEHTTLLDDASKQYRKLSAMKERFQAWKQTYQRDYDQAYGALSLSSVFGLHVRYEMFGLNPFETPIDFESTVWHQEISTFGMVDGKQVDPNAPEATLLTKIVEKTIVPYLITLCTLYDPFSAHATQCALQMMSKLLDYLDRISPAFKRLVDALLSRIQNVLAIAAEHAAPSTQFLSVTDRANAVSGKREWFDAHIQLLENILAWGRFADPARIQALVMGICVDHVLVQALEGSLFFEDDLDLYEKLLEVIPKQWTVSKGQGPSPAMIRLSRVFNESVVSPALALARQHNGGDRALLGRIATVCTGVGRLAQAAQLAAAIRSLQ